MDGFLALEDGFSTVETAVGGRAAQVTGKVKGQAEVAGEEAAAAGFDVFLNCSAFRLQPHLL